jgi:hypothetical protein
MFVVVMGGATRLAGTHLLEWTCAESGRGHAPVILAWVIGGLMLLLAAAAAHGLPRLREWRSRRRAAEALSMEIDADLRRLLSDQVLIRQARRTLAEARRHLPRADTRSSTKRRPEGREGGDGDDRSGRDAQ